MGFSSAFNPANLFAGVSKGIALDLTDPTKLYQDSARTTLVSVAGDPIGSPTDLSGNGAHPTQTLSAARPLWQTTYAAFDGSDDGWVTPSIDFTGTDKITVVVGVTKLTDTGFGVITELGPVADTTTGTFNLGVSTTTGDASRRTYSAELNGSQASSWGASVYAAPNTAVLSAQFNIAGALRDNEIIFRINGAAPSTSTGGFNTSAGTGNFTANVLNIGRRTAAATPLNGRIYRLIVIGRLLTASELAQAERWCASPAGVTLP